MSRRREGGEEDFQFHVTKLNNHGKRQQRTLCLSKSGIANKAGSTTRWFIPRDQVHSVRVDPEHPHRFYVQVKDVYRFEGEGEFQVRQVQEAFELLGLGHTSSTNVSIENFELLRLIGRGSFGKVLMARYKATGEIFAMKVLSKDDLERRDHVEETFNEVQVLASVSSPFTVKLHYFFQTRDNLYLVMDFCNGGELFYHLRKVKRFSEELTRFYLAEIICGVNYLHSHDIIFRDLKPENCLLDFQGHIKLTDFGSAKAGISSSDGVSGGVRASTFVGTPEYLAPEVLQGKMYGKAVDWYSLGIFFYEMITGRVPFGSEGTGRQDVYNATLKADLRFPEDISEEARSLIRGLLVRNPEKRLGSGPQEVLEIQNHDFFRGVDWEAVAARQVAPPFKPSLPEGEVDVSNFNPKYTTQELTDEDKSSPSATTPRHPRQRAVSFDRFNELVGRSRASSSSSSPQ